MKREATEKLADEEEKDFIKEIEGWRRKVVTTRKWQELEPRRVLAVEAIVGRYETKLSLEPGAVITEVWPASWLADSKLYHSRWLEGTFEGRVGLGPEICGEYLP